MHKLMRLISTIMCKNYWFHFIRDLHFGVFSNLLPKVSHTMLCQPNSTVCGERQKLLRYVKIELFLKKLLLFNPTRISKIHPDL